MAMGHYLEDIVVVTKLYHAGSYISIYKKH